MPAHPALESSAMYSAKASLSQQAFNPGVAGGGADMPAGIGGRATNRVSSKCVAPSSRRSSQYVPGALMRYAALPLMIKAIYDAL